MLLHYYTLAVAITFKTHGQRAKSYTHTHKQHKVKRDGSHGIYWKCTFHLPTDSSCIAILPYYTYGYDLRPVHICMRKLDYYILPLVCCYLSVCVSNIIWLSVTSCELCEFANCELCVDWSYEQKAPTRQMSLAKRVFQRLHCS